jgi:spermidine synthase
MFPVATRLLQPDRSDAEGGAIARAYAWNTFGALAGSLTAGILIAPRMDFYPALYLLAAGYGLSAIIILMWAKKLALLASASRASLGGLCLLAPIVALTGLKQTSVESPLIARLRTRSDAWEAPFHRPGVQGVTTVLRRKGEPFGSHLLINGRGMTAKVTDTKMMAHLPLLLHPNPENTLVICFGMGTTFRSAITHGGQVTVVELVPDVLDAFDLYHADTAAVRAYPRGRMVANDGRNFLKLTRERYDIITVDPPPPVDAAGVNSLYCRDFVELARTRLKPGGLLAHWIPSPGTGGVNDVATFNMMLSTLYHAFPHTYVLTGIDAHGVHVFSSERPLQYDLQRIKERLSIPAVARDVTEWRDVPLAFFAALAEIPAAEMAGIPQITDDEPALEFNLLRNWRLGTLQPSPIVPW